MARKKTAQDSDETFGRRLARLRKAAGYTQRQLAPKLGISQRMLAYYESQTQRPPAALMPALAQELGVSADQLLGLEPLREGRVSDVRLRRRIVQLEKLPAKEKREVIKILDLFIERNQLRELSQESK